MEFKQLQDGCVANAYRYGEKHGVTINEEFAILKLGEEYGEFIQAYMIQRKMSRSEKLLADADAHAHVSEELADIVGSAMVIAGHLDVDLETQLRRKWLKEIIPNEQ